jgi:hypothetical protein
MAVGKRLSETGKSQALIFRRHRGAREKDLSLDAGIGYDIVR